MGTRALLLLALAACGGRAPLLPVVGGSADPDGEDDGEVGPLPALARAPGASFVATPPPPPGTWPRVCDVRGFAGDVFAAHLDVAITRDGAQIQRYDPRTRRWTRAFDWDRGGGAGTWEVGGQGIARLRVIDGRLWASDADAPLLGGFGLSGAPFEDYLFVSDGDGRFPPLGPRQTPPAGTRLLPFAFHAFDVIQFRGAVVASGGTVPLGGRFSWGRGPFPGGIFVGTTVSPALRVVSTVGGPGDGVVRTTYLHRFRGRLYLGVQNNEDRVRFDLAVVGGDLRAPRTIRVTPEGGWLTRRFASGGGRLYWVAARQRRGALFESTDGERFVRRQLAGEVQDVAVAGEEVYVLTTAGLFRRDGERFARIAAPPPGDPFGVWDPFCSAPLEIAAGSLWAGSLRDGRLWQIVPAPPSPLALVEVRGFRLMTTEVTNAQFAAFVAETRFVTDAERAGGGYVWTDRWRFVPGASWERPHGPGSSLRGAAEHAVVQVSARDAEAFCAHHGLRLPDEREWAAAASPDGRRFAWGDEAPSAARGNVGARRCCAPDAADGALRVGPVGRYPAGAFGLFDMTGNVWEWTSTSDRGQRIIRGGGWGNSPEALETTIRHTNRPEATLDMVGFRCASGLTTRSATSNW